MPTNSNFNAMKQPTSTEAHIADYNRDKVHPDVAIHTHLIFMGMMRDWLEDFDPFIKNPLQDASRQELFEIMEGMMDMYEAKQ